VPARSLKAKAKAVPAPAIKKRVAR
jgi:hypothetical protein